MRKPSPSAVTIPARRILSFLLLAVALAAGTAAAGCDDAGNDELATCDDFAERMCECFPEDDLDACLESWAGGCEGAGVTWQGCGLACDLDLDCGDYDACTSDC